ncbi:hypothetical protein [Marinobacter similis]|uniref:MarR family transcriptional regulator n=1 Tax=Marinobacter similis TaxID=1420916 RepID=W5YKW8_9GAMM|nr:hypothetical protein [Marinobacter similis]AHI29721.1 MarR family transcriptional regulator [Marinobacter similis]
MNANVLINAISLFREYEEDIPVGTILCFLHLCDNDEATVSQVENRFKFGKSRTSRNMRNLTDRARPGKAGIDVADTRPDPQDYRVSIFSLNAKGKALKEQLMDALAA